jgi:hypothetical protein
MMDSPTSQDPSLNKALEHLQSMKKVASAGSVKELCNQVLLEIVKEQDSLQAFLYINDSRLPDPICLLHEYKSDLFGSVDSIWKDYQSRIAKQDRMQPIAVTSSGKSHSDYVLYLYGLGEGKKCLGMFGLMHEAGACSGISDWLHEVLTLFVLTADRLVEMEKQRRQISHLNTYITVSSMLAQSLGLRELIQSALCCCKEIACSEEESILLLDEEKKNFFFYELEGSTKEVLVGSSFPADKGIAGAVMKSLKSEIVSDVQNDPRFYRRIDNESHIKTRNMIVVPLVAGEENIGVMEVLNKIDGGHFTQEEHLSLKLIAEEIAFAIRNARIFEYVVDSYCKQRQGLRSCKGCKRPLGSWTPCARYRETEAV